jgi:glycosidase
MWGGDDPDCRKPMVWREFKYDTETAHPFGLQRPADKVEFDENLFGWYRKMAYVRNNNKALSLGDITFSFFDESKQILIYRRSFKGKNVFMLTNNSGLSNSLNYKDVKLPADKNSYLDLISGEKIEPAKSGGTISLKPYQIMILK